MQVDSLRIVTFHAALAYATAGVLWDTAGALHLLPPWWPPVGYVLVALGVALTCAGVLLRILGTPRGAPSRAALTALELAATGVLLAALFLRGDAEIPPDPPLVAAQLVALAGLLLASFRRRRRGVTF